MSWNRRLMLAEAVKGGEMELDYLTIIPEGGNATIRFDTWGYIKDDGSWVYAELRCSGDGGVNWVNIPNGQSITIPQGKKLMLKANYYDYILANSSKFGDNYNRAIIAGLEGQYSVEGTPLSLAHGDDFKTRRELAPGMFMGLFGAYYSPAPRLIRINNPESFLPSTELATGCYNGMFSGCSELENAPVLPATTLVAGCYYGMFFNCIALENAPVLPATTLAQECYGYMFSGCTNLVEAPELPATELAVGCYAYMFSGCTSLTKAPILPAPTLITGCYQEMFYGCENLNYIEAMFTTRPSNDYTYYWVYGVSSTGTFVMSKDADWYLLGSYGIPYNWTVQTK